jgi:cardiolipin synthase
MNLPNILTLSRMVMLPVLIGLFFVPGAVAAWTALGLYIVSAVTDFLDGYLARSMNATSALGRFLDPISDKIFVAALLVALVAFDRLPDLWIIPAIVILSREFMVSGLREYLGPYNIQIPVSRLAKWKTAIQMTALGFLVIGNYGDVLVPGTLAIGQWGLAASALITLYTGWSYLKAGILHITDQDKRP